MNNQTTENAICINLAIKRTGTNKTGLLQLVADNNAHITKFFNDAEPLMLKIDVGNRSSPPILECKEDVVPAIYRGIFSLPKKETSSVDVHVLELLVETKAGHKPLFVTFRSAVDRILFVTSMLINGKRVDVTNNTSTKL